MPSREQFFEFVIPRDGEESRFAVRAWSADEAQANIGQVLREAGIENPGSLIASPMRRPPASILGARVDRVRADMVP